MSEFDLDDLMADQEPEQTGPSHWDCPDCWTEVPADLEECLGCGRWRFKTVDTSAGAAPEIDPVPNWLRMVMKAAPVVIVLMVLVGVMYAVVYVKNMFTWIESEATIVGHHYRQETVIVDANLAEVDRISESADGIAGAFPKATLEPGQQAWCQANYSVVLEAEAWGQAYQDRIAPMKPFTDMPQPCEGIKLYRNEIFSQFTKGTKLPVHVNGNGAIVPDLFKMSGLTD